MPILWENWWKMYAELIFSNIYSMINSQIACNEFLNTFHTKDFQWQPEIFFIFFRKKQKLVWNQFCKNKAKKP